MRSQAVSLGVGEALDRVFHGRPGRSERRGVRWGRWVEGSGPPG